MPIPNHCINCDKVAVVLEEKVPYCVKCYRKEYDSNEPNRRKVKKRKNP